MSSPKGFDSKREKKTAFPLETFLPTVETKIEIPPGRYLIRMVHHSHLAEKETKLALPSLKPDQQVSVKELEDRLYDDQRQAIIIAAGDDFVGPTHTEKMRYKTLDRVVIDLDPRRPQPFILLEGHALYLIPQSIILAKVGQEKDFSLLVPKKK